MGQTDIEDVLLTPLKQISHPKGDIYHGMKKSDEGFVGFGEVYFSAIKYAEIKGWSKHNIMTMNLVVPVGKVAFVIYDDRNKSKSNGTFLKIELSPVNYKRLTIPPRLWYAFKGKSTETNLILDLADIEHDPDEIERLDLNRIDYNWNSA